MGVYDIFVYECPNCGKETSSQTKLGECSLSNFELGGQFPRDGKILMKDACEHCGLSNTVIIKNGIITKFAKGTKAIFQEGYWGSCNKIDKEYAKGGTGE